MLTSLTIQHVCVLFTNAQPSTLPTCPVGLCNTHHLPPHCTFRTLYTFMVNQTNMAADKMDLKVCCVGVEFPLYIAFCNYYRVTIYIIAATLNCFKTA